MNPELYYPPVLSDSLRSNSHLTKKVTEKQKLSIDQQLDLIKQKLDLIKEKEVKEKQTLSIDQKLDLTKQKMDLTDQSLNLIKQKEVKEEQTLSNEQKLDLKKQNMNLMKQKMDLMKEKLDLIRQKLNNELSPIDWNEQIFGNFLNRLVLFQEKQAISYRNNLIPEFLTVPPCKLLSQLGGVESFLSLPYDDQFSLEKMSILGQSITYSFDAPVHAFSGLLKNLDRMPKEHDVLQYQLVRGHWRNESACSFNFLNHCVALIGILKRFDKKDQVDRITYKTIWRQELTDGMHPKFQKFLDQLNDHLKVKTQTLKDLEVIPSHIVKNCFDH